MLLQNPRSNQATSIAFEWEWSKNGRGHLVHENLKLGLLKNELTNRTDFLYGDNVLIIFDQTANPTL